MNITKNDKTVSVIEIPKPDGTLKDYAKRYPIEKVGKDLIFYKAVHKNTEGEYFSDYNNSYIYKIGKEYQEECSQRESGCCSKGLHVAPLSWAKSFGFTWSDLAILKCSVKEKDLVISEDTDGKVRCSKLKILEEVK